MDVEILSRVQFAFTVSFYYIYPPLSIGLGLIMIFLTLYVCFQWWRGRLFEHRWLLQAFVWAVLLPNVANQAGWFAAEMGRQHWVVYGLLRTSGALSATVKANQVLFSLIKFFLLYSLLFALSI